jgi:hypothetical protein
MREYLIQAADEGELWPASHRDRNDAVLRPRGWDAKEIDGWGDYRMLVEGVEVAFSGELAGWQVSIEGDMDSERADLLVDTIAAQVAQETGRPTKVVAL